MHPPFVVCSSVGTQIKTRQTTQGRDRRNHHHQSSPPTITISHNLMGKKPVQSNMPCTTYLTLVYTRYRLKSYVRTCAATKVRRKCWTGRSFFFKVLVVTIIFGFFWVKKKKTLRLSIKRRHTALFFFFAARNPPKASTKS